MLELYLRGIGFPALIVLGAVFLGFKLPSKFRIGFFTTIFTLMLTPSWAPATIVAIPLPFGYLLGASLFGGFIRELPPLVLLFWWWHIIAFPLTALLGQKIGKRIYNSTNDRAAYT